MITSTILGLLIPFIGTSLGAACVPVSYTHLDVYKRQSMLRWPGLTRLVIPRARDVSRPMIPLGASVTGFDFSSVL